MIEIAHLAARVFNCAADWMVLNIRHIPGSSAAICTYCAGGIIGIECYPASPYGFRTRTNGPTCKCPGEFISSGSASACFGFMPFRLIPDSRRSISYPCLWLAAFLSESALLLGRGPFRHLSFISPRRIDKVMGLSLLH